METVFTVIISTAEIICCIYNHSELGNIIVNIIIRLIFRIGRNCIRVGCFFNMSIVNFLDKFRTDTSLKNMIFPLTSVEIIRNNRRIIFVDYNIKEVLPPLSKLDSEAVQRA